MLHELKKLCIQKLYNEWIFKEIKQKERRQSEFYIYFNVLSLFINIFDRGIHLKWLNGHK